MATNDDLVHVGTIKKNIRITQDNMEDLIGYDGRCFIAAELIDKAFNETPKVERKRGHWIQVHEHMWQMFDGEIDTTAYCEGYHNGPVCEICGAHPCIHCNPDWGTSKCYDVSYRCSECNAHKKDKTNFCPDCGAEMEVT